jgi:hypothetical protein
MTTVALKAHPKIYWIWNHRRWCLEHVPERPTGDVGVELDAWRKKNWDRELVVVERMLDADARNCTYGVPLSFTRHLLLPIFVLHLLSSIFVMIFSLVLSLSC